VGILRTKTATAKLQTLYQTDTELKTREKALEGLAYIGDPISNPIFLKALWSDNKAIRTSAAEGLARSADPTALPEVEKALQAEKDSDVKLAMEFAVTAAGKTDYLSDMIESLPSKSRGDIAAPYLIELSRKPEFLPKLYPYLQNTNAGVRKKLCTVLMYSGDATSLDNLDRLTHDSSGDVAAEALRAKKAIRARLDAGAAAQK
jgi:HEAT repeat protein